MGRPRKHNDSCQCDKCDNAVYSPFDNTVNYRGQDYKVEIEDENYSTLYFCKEHLKASTEPEYDNECAECDSEDGPDDEYMHELEHWYPCQCCGGEISTDDCECGELQILDQRVCDYPNHNHNNCKHEH